MFTTEQAAAIAAAQDATQNRPNDFAAFELLGNASLEIGRLDDAMSAFQRAIALNPGTAFAYCQIAWIHYQIGTPYQAIAAFEQAIANDPHLVNAYQGLGWLYVRKLFDYERAILTYERGLSANPGDPSLADYLGSTYARMGQTEKALQILEQSAREFPNAVFVYSSLCYIYFRMNRLEEAAACARREIAMRDGHSPHRVLGLIHLQEGRNEEAIAELERAIQLEALDYEARAALAKLYRAGGRLSAAQDQYNTGLTQAARDEEGGLGCFHAVYGDLETALDLLETACARDQISPGWLRIDPELFFIQDEPRFQALVLERN